MRTWILRLLRQLIRITRGALHMLATAASAALKSRATLHLENLALRHQLGVLRRSVKRPRLTSADRLLWAWLCEAWSDWRSALVIVKPETVIGWHRQGFRLFWTWKVRHGQPGRPPVSKETRQLIRKMSRENPLWGAPRIHGELLKLGIDIGETSVGKYLVRSRKPPSQDWRTFLENHVKTMVSVDFFTVPTIRFQVLYVFLVLAHDRRRIVHFNVTAHPTAEWTTKAAAGAARTRSRRAPPGCRPCLLPAAPPPRPVPADRTHRTPGLRTLPGVSLPSSGPPSLTARTPEPRPMAAPQSRAPQPGGAMCPLGPATARTVPVPVRLTEPDRKSVV